MEHEKHEETLPLLQNHQRKKEEENQTNDEKVFLSNYDQILPFIGDMGIWQLAMVAILWPPSMAGGIIVLLSSFTALEPRAFRCALEACDGPNAAYGDVNASLFFSQPGAFCSKPMLEENVTKDAEGNCSQFLTGFEAYQPCRSQERIIYDDFEFETTIATEFDLVCDQQYKVALSGTLYFVGLLIGSLIGGYPADSFGRKPVLFFFVFMGGFATLIGGLVSTFPLYTLFRLLAGIGEQGLTQITCTMSVEIVGANYQSLVGNLNQTFFALGTGVTGLFAYLIRDWRSLHFAAAGMIIPQLLLWWFIPESPRWLINKEKWRKLKPVLNRCFKWNKATLPSNLMVPNDHKSKLKKVTENVANKIKWYEMFTSGTLRKRSFIMMFNWGMVALVYYGIGMSMTQLGGDIFINFILAAVGEILGYIYNITVADYWGRKPTMITGFLISGICCVTAGVIPQSTEQIENLRLVLLIMGKMGASGAFATCYVYTSELFPTPIRTTSVGFCSMSSRLVSIAAPYLTLYLPGLTFKQLPFIVFGLGTLLAAVASIFLPESLGHPLPDSMEEASRLGTKPFWTCWSRRTLQAEVARQRMHNLSCNKTNH